MSQALTPRFVGLDVHKRQITVCVLDAQGRRLLERTYRLTCPRLEQLARTVLWPSYHVALEATTNCWADAAVLRPQVARVVVSNPLVTKAIAEAMVKTDKVDAYVLAQLLRSDFLPEVWQPDEATQRLRELTGRRAALVQQRTALRNRVHSVLAVRLVDCPDALFSADGLAWLAERLPQLDAQAQLLLASDQRQLASLQAEIDALDQELARRGWNDERVKLLMTLPGVSVTTAESLLAALGDINRFATPDQAAAYLGLVPSTRQSADKCYHGPVTKRGNNQARWMLIQAARCVAPHPGPLGHFFRRLARRKNHNVAVVATARKLARIAWYLLRENEPYRYATSVATATKLAALRVAATQRRRTSGPPAGKHNVAKLPGGSRTVKRLDDVYAAEGLPRRLPLTPGERQTLAAAQAETFVDDLSREHRVPLHREAINDPST